MSLPKQKAIVTRLANAAKGEPYKIETITGLAPTAAQEQAAQWWQSGGTLAITITIDGKEDSRYERDYLDAVRIPKGWVARDQPKPKRTTEEILKDDPLTKKQVAEAHPTPQAPTAAPLPPPTLFNDPEAPAPNPQATASPGTALCWTCKGPAGHHDPVGTKELDRSPSGRLNYNRCPECGAQLSNMMSRRAILETYLRAQSSKAITAHHVHVPPSRKP